MAIKNWVQPVHTRFSLEELEKIMNEVKIKFPVGTVLIHKINKNLIIKKESNFRVIFDQNLDLHKEFVIIDTLFGWMENTLLKLNLRYYG